MPSSLNFKLIDPFFKVVHVTCSLNHMAIIVTNSIMELIKDPNKELPKNVKVSYSHLKLFNRLN